MNPFAVPEKNKSPEKRSSMMVTNSGQIDLNTDAVLCDRENEVVGFDSSESHVSVGVPESINNEVTVRDHEFCRVGGGLGANGSVNPRCDLMICGSGQEGLYKETESVSRVNDVDAGAELVDGVTQSDKCLDFELNDGVMNDLEHGKKSGVSENGSTCNKFELNREDQGGDSMIVCRNADQNAKGDVSDERDGNGQNCLLDEIADKGDCTVVGDENKVKVADNNVCKDDLQDPCASRIAESMSQLLDGIRHMEAKDVDFKECLHHEVPVSRNHLSQVETLDVLKQPSFEAYGQAEVMQCQTISINVTEALPLEDIPNECHGLNLVVDFNPYRNLPEVGMYKKSVSSEMNFCISDLIWGKVRGHPWWPGQIFDPSAASEKAKRHFKKENYLIAYLGDQTFAWNDASKIKPFQMYFSQMEKQSNLESFQYAVDCALDEVSRRVEYGLSCPCMPEEVFTKLKTQTIINAGIQRHSSRRDGGDRFLNAITFEPIKLVNFIKLLAESPLVESDRLEFAIARAQLLAFHRAIGYSQLPEFIVIDGLFKSDMEIIPMEEKGECDYQIDSQVLRTDIGYSHKRKHITRDRMQHCKKQKHLSDLMSDKCLHLLNDDHVSEREANADKSILYSSTRKRKVPADTSDDYYHKSQNRKLMQLQNVSVDEMWSQLRLAARDPTRESFLNGMVNFFAEFRNFTSPHYSASLQLCQDSYWTDRIIQSIPEGQSPLKNQNEREEFLPVTPTERGSPSFKPHAAADGEEHFDEPSEEDICPAALILEFTNLDSVPSETNLNKIFGRFGPLIESQTELLKKSRRARVVFKRLSDAESAFSSAGKYSIFGPSLFRYHLKVMPSSSTKAPVSAGRRGRKRSSGEGAEV